MAVADVFFRYVILPGRAGVLQRADRGSELRAELAANYSLYHRFLADELEKLGTLWPDPKSFDGLDEYGDACNKATALVVGEQVLRDLANARGAGLPTAPLVDERHRLVSADPSDVSRGTRLGDARAAAWQPPKPPPLGMFAAMPATSGDRSR